MLAAGNSIISEQCIDELSLSLRARLELGESFATWVGQLQVKVEVRIQFRGLGSSSALVFKDLNAGHQTLYCRAVYR